MLLVVVVGWLGRRCGPAWTYVCIRTEKKEGRKEGRKGQERKGKEREGKGRERKGKDGWNDMYKYV